MVEAPDSGARLLALAHLRAQIRRRLEVRAAGGPGSGRYPKGSGSGGDSGFVVVYHGTAAKNVESILANGIQLSKNQGQENDRKLVIWSTTDESYARSFAERNNPVRRHDVAVFEVHVPLDVSHELVRDGVYTFSSDLKPEWIRAVSVRPKGEATTWTTRHLAAATDTLIIYVPIIFDSEPRTLGGPGSGRYPKGSGSQAIKELRGKLDTTAVPYETRFLLPDGTRLKGEVYQRYGKTLMIDGVLATDTHLHAAGSPEKLDQLLDAGVLRYVPEGGVNVTRVPTVLQAQTIADDWNYTYKIPLLIDVQRSGNQEYLGNKEFALPVNPDAIRNFVKQLLANPLDRTLGAIGSGNFGHAGRPGEIGGSAAESNQDFASDPKLAAEAEAGIAAVEKLLDRAVKEADYKAAEASEWDQLSQEAQDKAYSDWEQDAQENLQNNSDNEIYNDVKAEQIEEIHSDDAFDEKIYEKVKAQLAEHGLKLGDEDFDTTHYHGGDNHPEINIDGVKHVDGTPLTKDEQLKVKNEWNSVYEDHFQKELDSRMEDKQDHIWELESESQMDQLSHEWGNMSDEEKFGIAKNTEGVNTWAQTYKPGLPDKWVTGVESQNNSDEDYARTHAIALKLTELRTDEIRQERGLVGKDREYEIKEQVKDPSYTGPKHYSIINKSTGEVIGASNSVEQAEVNARAWAGEGVSTPAMIENVWAEWKGSSTSPMGLAFQLATANELGGVHRMTDDEVTIANNAANFHGGLPTVQAYVRAQWEVSQTIMHKAGEESTDVYRGIMLPGESLKSSAVEYYNKLGEQLHPTGIKLINALPNQPTSDTNPKMVNFSFNGNEYTVKQERQTQYVTDIRDINPQDYETPQQTAARKIESLSRISTGSVYAKLPDLALKRAGAQSTTGTASVANDWNGVGHLPPNPTRVVLRVNAPRTSVISLPVYGQNSQEEHEVVLAGTRDRWSWDVWKFKAPHFSSQPIAHKKLKAARMLQAKILIDLQDIDRGQPHWLTDIPDSVVIRARERRLKTLGAVGSGNFGHVGRPGEIGGSGKGAKTFTSDEGYAWHEQGPVLDWAQALDKESRDVLESYASFGSSSINAQLRGTFAPTETKYRGDASPEVKAQLEKFGWADPDTATLDNGEVWERSGGFWQHTVPDVERIVRVNKQIAQINSTIADHGYVLPEAIEVGRAAYLPGVSVDHLKSLVDQTYEERGFTSTMVGPAGGRLDGYIAVGKAQSLYDRYRDKLGSGDKALAVQEIGTAVKFSIELPQGTKVAAIEAVRHLEDKKRRTESEVMLGSGAQYKILSVEPGGISNAGGGFTTPYMHVKMRYIGGGSSAPKVTK